MDHGKFCIRVFREQAGLLGWRSGARTGRFGIRVNVIEPGWVRTPLTDKLPSDIMDADCRQRIGRLLEPIDIARAVTFCAGRRRRSPARSSASMA
jgi:NAD(P)-dependent dehydrogenase (short-subunit alcohol dehydrogenase family)